MREAVDDLIVGSARANAESAPLARLIDAMGAADWARFFQRADSHGLTPLIADRWQAIGLLDAAPIDARDRLRAACRRNADRNERVRREVIEYGQLLAEADVPAIVLKGWPLLEMLYASPALRLITDMDVLIRPDCADAGLRALEAAGLVPLPRDREAWVEKHLPAYWRLNGRRVVYPLADMFDPDHPRSIELHVRVWETNFRGLRLGQPAGFWERSRIVDVAGRPMRVPSLEDMLIHLCVHWACHWIEREARLTQLVDLDRFARRFGGQIDWRLILRVSDAARVARFVFAALACAQAALGTPSPPDDAMERLRAACPPGLRRWIARHAADDAASMDYRRRDRRAMYRLTWLSARGFGERIGALRYAFLPPRGFIMQRYQLKRRWQATFFYLPYIAGRLIGRNVEFGLRNAEESVAGR